MSRQNDGCLAPFPIWDDVCTFEGRPWRGAVDVVSGGFPCQDISVAGRGDGIDGERSGLWSEMARIVGEVGPRYVFLENSPALVGRGLGRILGDLSEMGYDSRWGVVSAAHAIAYSGHRCADHLRNRFWLVGAFPNADGQWELQSQGGESNIGGRPSDVCSATPDPLGERLEGQQPAGAATGTTDRSGDERNPGWWEAEPDVGRVADGVAARVDRLRCLGNGQVPAVAALAWSILTQEDEQ